MTHSSSSSASCSNSSTWTSDTDATSILEAHHVHELSVDTFSKSILNLDVTDACGKPFELNQRVSTAISALGKAKDLTASTCNVLNRLINIYDSLAGPATSTAVKFVDHSHAALLHHPEKSATARPQLIAVPSYLATSWRSDAKTRSKRRAALAGPAIAWHHVLATVLIADERQPIDQMVDFLGALNQARPDLLGCYSLTANRQACRLWWSDVAGIYTTPSLQWDDPATATLLLKFLCRLSRPSAIDPTVCLEPMPPPAPFDRRPVWLVRDDVGGVYRVEHTIAVGTPWTRRNWIVAATEYRTAHSKSFAPCSRVVIKDSFPLVDSETYAENAILNHLHADGPFAGVTLPITSFVVIDGVAHIRIVETPLSTVKARSKHRLIMRGDGRDLYQCPSVLHFLMTMYDALEVHRHAHEEHQILHRDISLRNILYNELAPRQAVPGCTFASEILAHKYPASRLLQGPTCVLIDFDNAIWQGHSPELAQRQSVGTPAFVARAVSQSFSQGTSVDPRRVPDLVGNAKDCYLHAFGPERFAAASALFESSKFVDGPASPERAVHHPHHDAESFFWLTLHFLLTALPRDVSTDDNDISLASELIQLMERNVIGGLLDLRGCILHRGPSMWTNALHPGLRSLGRFLFAMAGAIVPYFDLMEPAPPAYHLHETLQRLFLQEMCRLLDTDELALDVWQRRTIPSHFDTLPSANRPVPVVHSRKRSAEGFERQDGGPRPRLSL